MSVYNEMNVQSITYPLKPRLALLRFISENQLRLCHSLCHSQFIFIFLLLPDFMGINNTRFLVY